jgi:hypothetical protein
MAIGPMNPQRVIAGSEFDLCGYWGHKKKFSVIS